MNDKFYEILIFCAIIITIAIILWAAWKLDCEFNKITKFVDDYYMSRTIFIDSRFLIGIDSNGNWIIFQADPNCTKVYIEGE